MNLFKWLTGPVSALMLVSCVTINIYFPAAAAEKAADRIIEDVWGQEGRPEAEPEAIPPEAAVERQLTPASVAVGVLNWLVPQAIAAQANINIDSPAISALQSQMKARHNQLKPYYDSGAVGLTGDGFVTVRDARAMPLSDRNKVNALVADENRDRKALYAEIARANGHPEWEGDIRDTFARRWIGNAAAGWWYQDNGSWRQK